MIEILIALVVLGFVGYLVVTFIPMVEPIRTIVIAGFALVGIIIVLKLLGVHVPYTL